MNAAQPFALPFSSASLAPGATGNASSTLGAAPPAAAAPSATSGRQVAKARKARRSRATRPASARSKRSASPEASSDEYTACLAQARICREQAQEAARLKRFQAAVGLFKTAIALCQRALILRPTPPGPEAAGAVGESEAGEYLSLLAVEMSAYDELARSMNRPLLNSNP